MYLAAARLWGLRSGLPRWRGWVRWRMAGIAVVSAGGRGTCWWRAGYGDCRLTGAALRR